MRTSDRIQVSQSEGRGGRVSIKLDDPVGRGTVEVLFSKRGQVVTVSIDDFSLGRYDRRKIRRALDGGDWNLWMWIHNHVKELRGDDD